MPFSAGNPNRNRNYVILVVALVVVFALVMGSYVTLSIAGQDTDAYMRFLTLLIVSLVPSALAAFRANTAATKSHEVSEKVDQVVEQTNGSLDRRIRDQVATAVEQALRGAGLPPVAPGTAPITKQEEV